MNATSRLGQGDLYELWHAAERGREGEPLKVVPSLVGNYIYSGHTLYGRLIKKCHWIREHLPGEREANGEILRRNLGRISALFEEAAVEIEEQKTSYARQLRYATSNDHRYSRSDYMTSKHLIAIWSDSIAPFIKAIKEHPSLEAFLKEHQLEELSGWKSHTTRCCEDLVMMERCSRVTPPFAALRKIANVRLKKLRPHERKALEQWVGQLNGERNYLSALLLWLFPRFLSSLINRFIAWLYGEVSELDSETLYRGLLAFYIVSEAKKDIDATLPHLIARLREHQLKFIANPDPSYLAWREQFTPGTELGDYTIEANVTRQRHHPYSVFTLNDPDLLLIIDINRFLPLIRASKQLLPGIAATWKVHRELSYGLVEKLQPISWQNKNEFKIHIAEIARYIKRCKQLKVTPNDFIRGEVGYLSQPEKGIEGRLRAQFSHIKEGFSYNGIEQGLARLLKPIEDDKTRRRVYAEIIKKAGIRPWGVKNAFKEIVTRSLTGKANEKKISSQKGWVRERAKLLSESTPLTLERSVLWINEHYNPPPPMRETIEKSVTALIQKMAITDIDKDRPILDLFVVHHGTVEEVPSDGWEEALNKIYANALIHYSPQ